MADYSDSVFINCPFDVAYKGLFDAIVFAVHDSGFVARCALEIDDGATNRLARITDIVGDCKYGIHDISRTQLDQASLLPRFNMPLELGIFLGCQHFGAKKHREKCCLVFDTERYRFQKFISDMAGHDIHAHSNKPERAIAAVRNWLRTSSGREGIPGAQTMCKRFRVFLGDLPVIAEELNLAVPELIFIDYTYIVAYWLQENTT